LDDATWRGDVALEERSAADSDALRFYQEKIGQKVSAQKAQTAQRLAAGTWPPVEALAPSLS
jgi:hypothetical protein